jgi:cytochrome c oxidase assembly protein subunit 11
MSQKKTHKTVIILGGLAAVVMFGFCFAVVPFYSAICKATGISTAVPVELTARSAIDEKVLPGEEREVTVQFTATNNMGMPWEFYPKTNSVRVQVGKNTQVMFYAKNPTDKDMTAQAMPSMTPVNVPAHFHKIECFCFKQQTLRAHESRDMPLIFNIDKDLPKEVKVITLAYTLFDVTPNSQRKEKQ